MKKLYVKRVTIKLTKEDHKDLCIEAAEGEVKPTILARILVEEGVKSRKTSRKKINVKDS